MPCDTRLPAGLTIEQRNKQVETALDRLEKALSIGQVGVKIGPQGSIAFAGWDDKSRDGVTDLCAYRRLTAKGSWALRQAVAKAEALAGRKVNEQAVGAGTHSHDNGKTWGKH